MDQEQLQELIDKVGMSNLEKETKLWTNYKTSALKATRYELY